MRYSVIFTRSAEDDLDAIAEFIARDNPRAAHEWIATIKDRIDSLSSHPERNRRRPQLGRGYRILVVGTYLVVYRIERDSVYVMRVFQGSRDYGRFL